MTFEAISQSPGEVCEACSGDPGLYVANHSMPRASEGTCSMGPGERPDVIIGGDPARGVQAVNPITPYDNPYSSMSNLDNIRRNVKADMPVIDRLGFRDGTFRGLWIISGLR